MKGIDLVCSISEKEREGATAEFNGAEVFPASSEVVAQSLDRRPDDVIVVEGDDAIRAARAEAERKVGANRPLGMLSVDESKVRAIFQLLNVDMGGIGIDAGDLLDSFG